ncbi:uncharacterized protein LOC116192983 [Punica granatum]|uniref:Uncharacterized protein LOC116192983 n=1 Tax=Punica granatum TaxID=22663 RepID=A0A6P8C919_PUNGR|nr:uncharacterized protein LOC116192983 [Punica granatum]
MSRVRAHSSPDLIPSSSSPSEDEAGHSEDLSLEGVAANVMLIVKLIHDHTGACTKENDDRKAQRVAGMTAILDDAKARIQKSLSSTGQKREAELRRCMTDLRPRNNFPRDRKKSPEPVPMDEKEQMRKQLSASLAARKSLEMMCSSLGKEKEIMATVLSRKVHELNEMEEMVSDYKAQNEMLVSKLQKERKLSNGGDGQGNANAVLQERNRELSEQLLKSLDGYKSLKKKLKEVQEEKMRLRSSLEEIGEEISVGLDQVKGLKEKIRTADGSPEEAGSRIRVEEGEIDALEKMLKGFKLKVSECAQRSI